MEEAKITTSVDVKLGHADMIEMLVEEQKELLEGQMATRKAESDEFKDQESELKKQIEESVIKDLKLLQRPEIKPLVKVAKELKLELTASSNVQWVAEPLPFKWDYKIDLRYIAQGRSANKDFQQQVAARKSIQLGTAESALRFHRATLYHHAKIDCVTTGFQAVSKNKEGRTDITLNKRGVEVKVPKQSALTKKLMKELRALTVKAANHSMLTLDIECQYFELEHSTKRHKAKFLKAMLANSTEGKSLLGLMKNVGGMNLLESGKK